MTRTCVHFGTHDPPVRIGDYGDDTERGDNLVDEQVHRIPPTTATNSTIVLEATKEIVGDMLVARDGVQQKNLEIKELFSFFDRC